VEILKDLYISKEKAHAGKRSSVAVLRRKTMRSWKCRKLGELSPSALRRTPALNITSQLWEMLSGIVTLWNEFNKTIIE